MEMGDLGKEKGASVVSKDAAGLPNSGNVMEIVDVAQAISWQAAHCEKAGAPITARIIRGVLAVLDGPSRLGERISNWPGLSLEDAMPLRITGGLHFLHLTGAQPSLARIYSGELTDQAAIDALVAQAAIAHDEALLPWLDGPPQTNEAGRSASVMAGLMWLSGRVGARFELLEIGASAGINTMINRYFYSLNGACSGPVDSLMRIEPEWRGEAPPSNQVDILSVKGCDIAPVDLSDPAHAQRLKAYIWCDAKDRMIRMEAAIQMAGEKKPDLVKMDAGEFVAQQLSQPQEKGVTRALFHSVMWQYMPKATRDNITEMMEKAGASATKEKPIAWLRVETNRATFRHELQVRYWDGSGEGTDWVQLAEAHPHGAWVEWLGAG